jgi:hypothetical protein
MANVPPITTHFFQPSPGITLPKNGAPQQLADHLRPEYPTRIQHSNLRSLRGIFHRVHTNALRDVLSSNLIAQLRRDLRRAPAETAGDAMTIVALTLATSRVVNMHNPNEAKKCIVQAMRLIRHRLEVDSTTAGGRLAQSMGRRAGVAGNMESTALSRTLGNFLYGLSFWAGSMEQADVDKNINAIHQVLTRNDQSKPGLGGEYKAQLPVIEKMLVVGSVNKMSGCHRLADLWILKNYRHLSSSEALQLAQTCIKYYGEITTCDFSNSIDSLIWHMTHQAEKKLSNAIHAAKTRCAPNGPTPNAATYDSLRALEGRHSVLRECRRRREEAEESSNDEDSDVESENVEPENVGIAVDPLENAYDLMGISPDATDPELRTAYRKLAMEFHPDNATRKGLTPGEASEAEEKFKQIGNAYDLILQARGLAADPQQEA